MKQHHSHTLIGSTPCRWIIVRSEDEVTILVLWQNRSGGLDGLHQMSICRETVYIWSVFVAYPESVETQVCELMFCKRQRYNPRSVSICNHALYIKGEMGLAGRRNRNCRIRHGVLRKPSLSGPNCSWIQPARLCIVSFHPKGCLLVSKLQSVLRCNKAEIGRIVVRSEHEVDLLLSCLIVDRSVAKVTSFSRCMTSLRRI